MTPNPIYLVKLLLILSKMVISLSIGSLLMKQIKCRFAAYVGSSGDLLCKSCLVWMCAAGWILSSSPTGAACCVPIWVGDLGMRRRRKKKRWEKKTSFCLLSA